MVIKKEDVKFRRATAVDSELLTEFRIRYLSETFGCGKISEAGELRESLLEYFAEAVPAGDFVAWLAEYEGEVIATSGMVVWRIPGGYTSVSGKAGYILNMYTLPEARGLGIASRLFDELINDARTSGVNYLHLHATDDGVAIYKRAGFVETGLPELEMKLR